MTDSEFILHLQSMREASGERLERYQKELYEELWPRLIGFLLAEFWGLSMDDYEEVTQESIIKIFMKIDQFKSRGSFSSWCMQIADNTMRDLLKRSSRKRNVVRSVDEIRRQIEADPTKGSAKEENGLLLDKVEKVLETLGDECKLIIRMRFWLKFSREKIAELLGLSESAVRKKQDECFAAARARFYLISNE